MSFWIVPISAGQLACVALSALAVALGFCALLSRYWAFYHLPVGGGFAFIVILPLAIVTSIVLAVALTLGLLMRGHRAKVATRTAIGVVAIAAVSVLAGHIRATDSMRSGEGAGTGDLVPFFRSLLVLR